MLDAPSYINCDSLETTGPIQIEAGVSFEGIVEICKSTKEHYMLAAEHYKNRNIEL